MMIDDRNWNLVRNKLNTLPEELTNLVLSYYDCSEHRNPQEIYWGNGSHVKTFREYKGRYFTGFKTVLYILYIKYNQYHLAKWEKDDSDYVKTCDKLLEKFIEDSEEDINSTLAGYLF